ncbi:4-hydroxybenzoate polyprenyltransferase, mitochondrial [Nymphon striatum]|nr:4-hydroxybenzoate polyprenyltransferase, mitochondrial [Nymphon striatum]
MSSFSGDMILNKLLRPGYLCSSLKYPYRILVFHKFQANKCQLHDKKDKPKLSLLGSLVAKSPENVKPYLYLARLDKPIGTWLLLWPCLWSIGLAAPGGCLPDLYLMGLFVSGAVLMRGAGCTINDMWDKDFDIKVERTKTRPLAANQITNFNALTFLGCQLSLSLLILLQFNWYSIFLGASSMVLVVTYPLMKRFTYWPQLFLGLTLNWGALLGWAAVQGSSNFYVTLPLYIGGVSWTLLYDTIYAHQDKKDDLLVGIKSTALLFGNNTKYWLSGFALTTVPCFAASGYFAEQTWPYFGSISILAAHFAWQVLTLNVDNTEDCWRKFISNRFIGVILFSGIITGTLLKKTTSEDQRSTNAGSLSLDHSSVNIS